MHYWVSVYDLPKESGYYHILSEKPFPHQEIGYFSINTGYWYDDKKQVIRITVYDKNMIKDE
jgi:hypothetical protein